MIADAPEAWDNYYIFCYWHCSSDLLLPPVWRKENFRFGRFLSLPWAADKHKFDGCCSFITCGLHQCLSTGCIVHPRVYQNFPGVYHCDGVYRGVPGVCSWRTITFVI